MAEFGVPYPYSDHAARALHAALEIRHVVDEFAVWMSDRFPGRELPPFAAGIGIHTGDAVVGNLGASKRMEYTAIGDMVNVAAHIEAATKRLSATILASSDTVTMSKLGILTGRKERILVKGRVEPVEVVEIIGINE